MKGILQIQTPLTDEVVRDLSAGDALSLSGTILTGRDVAHRRLFDAAVKGESLPVDIRGMVIFYAAPTPARPGRVIGSIGPTTSMRMDRYTPTLIELGLKGMIGKGRRSIEVRESIKKHNAVYFGAIGGIAALMSRCVKSAEVVAFPELGPEAMMRLEVVDLPLVVINDSKGGDLYENAVSRHSNVSKRSCQ
jgi:fumarate hydratase subunit beta